MRIKNNIINIKKDFFKKKNFTKIEIKKIILKSIIHNKNIKPILRSYAIYKYMQIPLKASISKQNNNICLKTGRIKGVLKETNISRHFLKKLSISGNLQNMKITSW